MNRRDFFKLLGKTAAVGVASVIVAENIEPAKPVEIVSAKKDEPMNPLASLPAMSSGGSLYANYGEVYNVAGELVYRWKHS